MPMIFEPTYLKAAEPEDSYLVEDSFIWKEYERIRLKSDIQLPGLKQVAINKESLIDICKLYEDSEADSMTIAEVAADYAYSVLINRRNTELVFWKILLETPRPTKYTAANQAIIISVDDCLDIIDIYQYCIKAFAGSSMDNRESLLVKLREIVFKVCNDLDNYNK